MSNRRVLIVGYGVVGKAMADLFKNKEVWVYDVSLLARRRAKKDGYKTISNLKRSDECGLAIVCVPTPMYPDGSANISIVYSVVVELESSLILIKSTVPPGTTDPLANFYDKSVAFSPEYIGESRYHTNYRYPHPTNARSHEFFNIGGEQDVCSAIWEYFKDEMCVDTRVNFSTAIEAELAKYMENAFFATKVMFCNEMYDICEMNGACYEVVRNMWLSDNRINPMHTAVFADKRGFGGKCFPKDVSAIIADTRDKGGEPTLLEAVRDKNEQYGED